MSEAETETVVRCVDLSLARGQTRVVDGVSFTLDAGEAIAIRGETGSGKSTLAAYLAHQTAGIRLDGGSASVTGFALPVRGRRRRVATYLTSYLSQRAGASLPHQLTVTETIAEPLTSRDRRVNRRALELRVAALLDELELPLGVATSYPYELSTGMRQRVALARSLMLRPRVLVADEPMAGLDRSARSAARAAITRRMVENQLAVITVSSDDASASAWNADIVVLRHGAPIAVGTGRRDLLWTPGADRRVRR